MTRWSKARIAAGVLVAMVVSIIGPQIVHAQSGGGALGAPDFKPTPQRPVGWRGDWTGRFPAATPPVEWSRRVTGITSQIKYQAGKPAAAEPGKDAQELEYFSIKDWLIAGPFAVDDPAADIEKDFLGGEDSVQPAKDAKIPSTRPSGAAKAPDMTWKYIRADVATQSFHECNGGTAYNTNVDFVYAFGKFFQDGTKTTVDGDFLNKVAYAHTYIYSQADAKVQLQIHLAGTAAKFWLNGKPTALDPKTSGRSINVDLVKGWNRLLIKVSTANGLGKDGQSWRSRWLAAAYITPAGPVTYETKNVAWMTKMTGRSMSQPIIVGDKIYIGSGISDLMCIDKKSGKVLWLRSNTPYDALTPEERAAITGMAETIEPLVAKLNTLNDELVTAINAGISPTGVPADQYAIVDAKAKAKITAERAVHDAFAAVDKKRFPQMYQNEVSSSNAVPVSDGKHVYWACGGAMYTNFAYFIVCFDLDGKRIWSRLDTSLGGGEHGYHASPALVDDKVIYTAYQTLIAYDAKTGKDVWRSEPKDWENAGCCGASPLVVRAGGGNVIINKRYVHSAANGIAIGRSNINKTFTDQTPIAQDGVVCSFGVMQGHGKPPSFAAVKIGNDGQAQKLWEPAGVDVWMPVRHNTIAESYSVASPLLVEGLIYGVDMSGGLTVLDLTAKQTVYRQWLDGYNRYNRYIFGVVASPTLGGKNIFITDDAGYTHVLTPGRQYKEIATNVLENIFQSGTGGNPCKQESFYTAPWFEGKFMYLRGEEYLYCIGEK